MTLKKMLLVSFLTLFFITFGAVFYAYHYKIVEGEYNKLSIQIMNETTNIITDKEEINRIIAHINTSPREFEVNTGLTYDDRPLGLLIFENETERNIKLLYFREPDKANIATKYWEIKTEFNMQDELNHAMDVFMSNVHSSSNKQ